MNFFVGQKVVCVSTLYGRYRFEIMPVKGEVYTIRAFNRLPDHYKVEDHIGLLLIEIHNPRFHYADGINEVAFSASAFRPVKTTDISIFTKMLAPSPKERVTA